MKILRQSKVVAVHGFKFHLPGGYPEPDMEVLKKLFNTHFNAQIGNSLDRESIRRNYGNSLDLEFDWDGSGGGHWKVAETFFA